MKNIKLVIGIVTLSCTLLLPLICSMYVQLNGFISSLIIYLFISAGLISLCACKSRHIISNLFPALFYFLIGIILLNFFEYVIPQCRVTIKLFITIMFVLTLTFSAFIVDKFIQDKYFNKDINAENDKTPHK